MLESCRAVARQPAETPVKKKHHHQNIIESVFPKISSSSLKVNLFGASAAKREHFLSLCTGLGDRKYICTYTDQLKEKKTT